MIIATDYVRHPDIRLVALLAGHAASFKKIYSYPSQETICKLFQRHAGRNMSRRTLNRHLGALETQHWIKRVRRHRRSRSGQLELHSTLYTLARQAIRWLARLRTAVSFLTPKRGSKLLDKFCCAIPGTTYDPTDHNYRRSPPHGGDPPKKEIAKTAIATMKN